MEDRLQHTQASHEPAGAHPNGDCSPPQSGAESEQTFLIIGGIMALILTIFACPENGSSSARAFRLEPGGNEGWTSHRR